MLEESLVYLTFIISNVIVGTFAFRVGAYGHIRKYTDKNLSADSGHTPVEPEPTHTPGSEFDPFYYGNEPRGPNFVNDPVMPGIGGEEDGSDGRESENDRRSSE